MATSDWKELLQSKLNTLPDAVEKENTVDIPVQHSATPKEDLILRFERRNGKPATIVSNFKGDETQLKELASALRKHCGTGGSAKDDEILIQGDVRQKAAAFLRNLGHKVRGDFGK